jgi:hypothetical protein
MTKVRWHLKHEQFGTKPWAVQAEGMRRAAGRERFGQFMQQGLGKTALNLNEFIDAENVDLNIVIAPNSFMGDWPLAPAEWGLGFLKTGMWPRDPMPYDWDCGLYVVGHETLRGSKRARDELAKLMAARRCLFTIDESTGIKNPGAELTRYVLQIVKDADMVRELNGTPLVLNVMDYWAQLRVLGELNGVNPYQFRNRFAVMGGFMGRQIKGVKNEEELGKLIDGCAFRALTKDWRKDMPPQVPVMHHYEMTDNQRKHYDTMMDEFYAMIGADDVVTADMVLTQRIKLQQISSCLLMDGDKVHWIEPPKKNPKLRAICDLFDYGNCKAIVPYLYKPSGAMLYDAFKEMGLKPAVIGGGMKPDQIVEQKAMFNNDPDCRVIVGQTDTMSRGHTLLGQAGADRCDRTYYYENSLSLMHRQQMDFRNYRGAQDQTTYLYDFVGSPVEQLNIDILTGKKALGDGIDAIVAEVRKRK